MRARDYLLTAGALALLASAALVLFGHASAAGELPPPAAEPEATEPGPPHGDEPGPEVVVIDNGPANPNDADVVDPIWHPSETRNHTGMTSGILMGDIPLVPSVLQHIESISVVVDELKNVRAGGETPYRKVVPVRLGNGTPTFQIRDVPFSDYGYVVRVHSPGLNGGQATVRLNAEHPIVDDLKLPITPGCPYSLLLRDQDRDPIGFTEIRMVPTGEPQGRPPLLGKTDNFGSVVFDNVLAGDYAVNIGPMGQPLISPPTITVQPGSFIRRGAAVQPQGSTIVVPRGVPVSVLVTSVGGYPLMGALVRLRATDQHQLREQEGETNAGGLVEFPNVLTGQWEIDVRLPDHQRRLKQLTIADGTAPPVQKFELVRVR